MGVACHLCACVVVKSKIKSQIKLSAPHSAIITPPAWFLLDRAALEHAPNIAAWDEDDYSDDDSDDSEGSGDLAADRPVVTGDVVVRRGWRPGTVGFVTAATVFIF